MFKLVATAFATGSLALFATCSAMGAEIEIGSAAKCNQIISEAHISQDGETAPLASLVCIFNERKVRYRVRYIWLDSRTLAYFNSGYRDQPLVAAFGKHPKILLNPVGRQVNELLSNFGSKRTFWRGGYHGTRVLAPGASTTTHGTYLGNREAGMTSVMIYDGEFWLPWPDTDASKHVVSQSTWPDDYALTYYGFGNFPEMVSAFETWEEGEPASSVLSCTLLYGFVQPAEFERYWSDVDLVASAIQNNELNNDLVTNGSESAHGAPPSTWEEAISKNPAYEALKYFTSWGFPEDFLVKIGTTEAVAGCYGFRTFGFAAIPRKLFVLYAVLENMGADLPINALTYRVDPGPELREVTNEGETREEGAGNVVLKEDETLVVPLRIELRYVLDEWPFSAIRENYPAVRVHEAISALDAHSFTFTGAEGSAITKTKSAFRPPKFSDVTQTYVFGESRILTGLRLGERVAPVREAPRNALLSYDIFEEGSCPFLYFRDESGDVWMAGRVLVGASSRELATSESVPIPALARSIILAEIEPEITVLKRVGIEHSDGGIVTLLENAVIMPGRQIEIQMPPDRRVDAKLVIEGYYRPISSGDLVLREGSSPKGQDPAGLGERSE